ncbi:MAG: prolyl oligopeptidase family serine peptidase [Pseudomonadota bacterium]
MTETRKAPNYFMYFPDNYRWSAEMMALLSAAPYGGPEIAEIDRAGRKLRNHVGDDDAWFRVMRAEGDVLHRRAQDAQTKRHTLTAASDYLRACSLYQHAEHFRQPKDDAALEVFRLSLDCFRGYAALTDRPRIEFVDLPFEGGAFPAIFVHAENTTAERTPCVVRFPGFDTQKELQYLRGVTDITRRGISVLIVDGPGSGEALRLRSLLLRHDYEVAGSAAINYLETRSDVDSNRIGIIALSLGGYFAPRCAAYDSRYKACVVWGALWDYHETWRLRIERLRTASLSVPPHHLLWVTGTTNYDDALKKIEGFRLDGIAQKVTCPLLVTHGTEDEQVPLADAQRFFDAVGSKDKTLRIFDAEESGAQHCQRDYLTRVCAVIADWLVEKL